MYRKKNVLGVVHTGFRFHAEFQDGEFQAFNVGKKRFNEFKIGDFSLNQCVIGKKFNDVWKQKQLQMMICEFRYVIC